MMKPQFIFRILALLFTVCAVSLPMAAHAQSLSSSSSSNPFAAQSDTFLPLDEAYQLSIRQNDESIIAEWVIADDYFLYGEQFRFTINGSDVAAERLKGKIAYDTIFEKDVEKYYVFTQSTIDKTDITDITTASKTMNLSVTFQGCADAGLCYPPETKLYIVDLEAMTALPSTLSSTSPTNTTPTASNLVSSTPKPINSNTTNTSYSLSTLLVMLGIAMIGGVLLNLMPCVFPVLSIKALSFANNSDPRSRIQHGWSYTAGVVASFLIIAIILLMVRQSGQAVGWGFQLQSPAVITFLTLLFFVMGLSLSGLLAIGGRWMGMGQSLTEGTQHRHSFFTGALAAVVASPCTAPFMATALGYALTQPIWIALGIFAALGFGMALPFLLLSYIPQLGRLLPKPGAWMETFKQAIAFPLYLTSAWLLWVLGQQVGNDAVIWVIVSAIGITFIAWLLQKTPQWTWIGVIAASIIIVSLSWANQQRSTVESVNHNPHWETYTQERLSQLRQEGSAVFVNLTADWCITCKFNESRVFTSSTLEIMKSKKIILLEGDWTNYNAEITTLLDEYSRGGVPLYLLFPAKPNAKAIILPQLINPKDFIALIERF